MVFTKSRDTTNRVAMLVFKTKGDLKILLNESQPGPYLARGVGGNCPPRDPTVTITLL